MTVFEALADPTRRRIVEMLARGALPAGEIARRFSTSHSALIRLRQILLTTSELGA